jgi:hypothetical protein
VFQAQVIGIEVGGDSSFGKDKWAYFKFFTTEGKELNEAKAFAKEVLELSQPARRRRQHLLAVLPGRARPARIKALNTVKSAH